MVNRQIPRAAIDEAYRLAAETALSQADIAQRVGVNQSTISRWFWDKFRELARKEINGKALKEQQRKCLDAIREGAALLNVHL